MRLDVDMLRDSFSQALAHRPDLGARFITRLLEAHPELSNDVFELGDSADQLIPDLARVVLGRLDEPHWVEVRLLSLGAQHPSAEDGEVFGWVMQSLVDVMRESLAERWTDRTEAAWAGAADAFVRLVRVGARAAQQVALTTSGPMRGMQPTA